MDEKEYWLNLMDLLASASLQALSEMNRERVERAQHLPYEVAHQEAVDLEDFSKLAATMLQGMKLEMEKQAPPAPSYKMPPITTLEINMELLTMAQNKAAVQGRSLSQYLKELLVQDLFY